MNARSAIQALLLTAMYLSPLAALRGEDAETILQTARLNPTTHSASLRAQIRGESSTLPLTIRMKDGVVRYEFTKPDQTILLKLSPTETELTEELDGITKPISPSHRHDQIRNSGITYQDLSLGFLYWPHPFIQGEETINFRSFWKIDLQAPATEPLYGVARIWIDKESGAIWKIEGYDKKGLLLRRFLVTAIQEIDGATMLKQMRIESFAPGNSHDVLSRNYLEISGKL